LAKALKKFPSPNCIIRSVYVFAFTALLFKFFIFIFYNETPLFQGIKSLFPCKTAFDGVSPLATLMI
jgi:hypothetical protein